MSNLEQAGDRQRVVVVGGGFGGFFAARALARKLGHDAELTVVSDSDGLLYQPLLPDVAVGAVDPRAIAVSLLTSLPGARLVRGRATSVSLADQEVSVRLLGDRTTTVPYDHLLLAPGGVTRLPDIPGLAENAVGFKTVAEALYLRDHVLRQLEEAAVERDETRRRGLLTFVVVGAGYAGTELAAQMARLCGNLSTLFEALDPDEIHWVLLDMAPAVMPELGEDLGAAALDLLRARGVDVRLRTSLKEVTEATVTLSDDSTLDCTTVVWCGGVTSNPLIAGLGLPTTKGRLVVDPDLTVPGQKGLYAIGDAAAVPDLTKPVDEDGEHPLCPPTAQHAMRQGSAAARSITAAVRGRPAKPYRHRDLGLVVDLGGWQAAAKPLGVELRGGLAKVVTRGYHLYALPSLRRRVRVALEWATAGKRSDDVSFGLLPLQDALASRAEHNG